MQTKKLYTSPELIDGGAVIAQTMGTSAASSEIEAGVKNRHVVSDGGLSAEGSNTPS